LNQKGMRQEEEEEEEEGEGEERVCLEDMQ